MTALLKSALCTQASIEDPRMVAWIGRMDPKAVKPDGAPVMHRKFWEHAFVAQALHERGMLRAGKRGVGFATGTERLPALFAGMGCTVLATDLPPDSGDVKRWSATEQHATGLRELYQPHLCNSDDFAARVQFQHVDMKSIPDSVNGFDFCWSACALEHLGSLETGLHFIERSLKCLKSGGVAVHTTEFNLSSNRYTVDRGGDVIYRRRDIEGLQARLHQLGCSLEIDYAEGDGPFDSQIDPPPYSPEPHLKLLLHGYVSTSLGLIVEKRPAVPLRQKTLMAPIRRWALRARHVLRSLFQREQ